VILRFGIGGGWNQREMRNHGTKPSLRWKLLRERILAMKRIWAEDEAEFHGELVDFDPIWSWPKPVQQPDPPILVGGDGPRTLERVLACGDGWIPFIGNLDAAGEWRPAGSPVPRVLERAQELQRLAAEAGRGPVPLTICGAPLDRAALERFQAVGADRCLFMLPPASAAVMLPLVERCAAVAQGFG